MLSQKNRNPHKITPKDEELVFQPWMCCNGSFASVSIVVQQFFTCFNVSGSYQYEMRHTINVMELCLTIATFAVINQSSQTISFFCSINTERTRTECRIAPCHAQVMSGDKNRSARQKDLGIHTRLKKEGKRSSRNIHMFKQYVRTM